MRRDSKFVDMIIALTVAGLAFICFVVLLINYEIQKPNLPTPTPIITPTLAPTNTPEPTPTPGYTAAVWNKLFKPGESTYVVTESVMDKSGVTLVDTYKLAGNSAYYFDQTSEKAAKESWNVVAEADHLVVSGTLALNSEGVFAVNKTGYKSAKISKEEYDEINNTYLKTVQDLVSKYNQEIPYERYECITVYELYKTKADDKYQSTVTIKDGKLALLLVEYVDDSDAENPVTIKVFVEIGSITEEEIIETNPKK